jgi:hypothetical protein
MVDGVQSDDKVKVTYFIDRELARFIKKRAIDLDKTFSCYISDLVKEDLEIVRKKEEDNRHWDNYKDY